MTLDNVHTYGSWSESESHMYFYNGKKTRLAHCG